MKKLLLSFFSLILLLSMSYSQEPPVEFFNFEGAVETHPEFSGSLFQGVVENPLKSGINVSDSVGFAKTGSNSWDGFTYFFPNLIDLQTDTIFTMMVYHPDSTGSTRLQFNGLAELKSNVDYSTPGAWQKLTWHIPKSYDGKFEKVLLVFAHNRANKDEEWYFDELKGPTSKMIYPPMDYYNVESYRKDFTGFSQATYEGVVENPNPDAVNSKAYAAKAMTGSVNYAGIKAALPGTIDFSETDQFTMSVYSDSIGYVRIQLEGTGGAQCKISVPYTKPGEWQELVFDASNSTGSPATDDFYDSFVLIFDDKDSDLGEEWYFDNLKGPQLNNPGGDPATLWFDFETPETSVQIQDVTWDAAAFGGVVLNPLKDAVNGSDSVGLMYTGSNAWDYIHYDLPTPVDFSYGISFKMKVYCADSIGGARIQLDDVAAGKNLKMSELYTTPGAWQEITFSADRLLRPNTSEGTIYGNSYTRVKLIFDDQDGDLAEEWYFDDLIGQPLRRMFFVPAVFQVVGDGTGRSSYEIELNNSGEMITLYNDGAHGDGAADDSLFAVTLSGLPAGDHTYSVYGDGVKIGSGIDIAISLSETMLAVDNTFQFNHDITAVKTLEASDYLIYPNPAYDMITVKSNSRYLNNLDVYDVLGSRLKSLKINSVDNYILDISELKSGIYFVRITDSLGEVNTARFIKQ